MVVTWRGTMRKEIIVLTMSDKHKGEKGGYCVAGIELGNANSWIRLIGNHEYFKINNTEVVYADGNMCKPLDVISVDVEKMTRKFRDSNCIKDYDDNMFAIQPENYFVLGRFEFVRKSDIDEVMRIAPIGNSQYIYMNSSRSLSVEEAMRNGSSLTMVKVDNLELYPKKKYQDDGYQAHYRAKFDYNGVHYEDISVTDPDYDAARTEYAGLVFGETYIIVSIGEEFNDRHYKIIAKIFELVYTIENNRFKLFHAFRDCQYLEKYSADIKYGLYDHLEETGELPCKKCQERLAEIYGE